MGFEEKHVRLEGVPPVQDAQGREGTSRREGCCPFGLLFALLPSLLWLNSRCFHCCCVTCGFFRTELSCGWSGNPRELESCMVRAVGAADTESTWLSKISGPAGDDSSTQKHLQSFLAAYDRFSDEGNKNKQAKQNNPFLLSLSLSLFKQTC